ncbi:MAG: hypothetical protein QM744_14380 [Mesorhizobium sp.]
MDLASLAFAGAIAQAREGDPRPLAALLRQASLEMTAVDRAFLADYIEGKLKRPRGRPKRTHTQKLAEAQRSDAKVVCSLMDLYDLDVDAALVKFAALNDRPSRDDKETIAAMRHQSRKRRTAI